jgi:hypothetical protein
MAAVLALARRVGHQARVGRHRTAGEASLAAAGAAAGALVLVVQTALLAVGLAKVAVGGVQHVGDAVPAPAPAAAGAGVAHQQRVPKVYVSLGCPLAPAVPQPEACVLREAVMQRTAARVCQQQQHLSLLPTLALVL